MTTERTSLGDNAEGSDTSDKPCQFEIEILQETVGEREPRPWGAAVGAALEYLRGHGYLLGTALTDKGRALLTEAPTAASNTGDGEP